LKDPYLLYSFIWWFITERLSGMAEKLLFRIQIKGKVQGVGFRWSAASVAIRLGITGYVKNLPDKSVYIEAEGTTGQLAEFMEWCRKGPGIGFVESVQADQYPPAGYKDFRIEH
jgi:acylphosphatase